jgi:tRNA pseudouridine(38-40) synthase
MDNNPSLGKLILLFVPCLYIRGVAFLWHMVRCIMAVLFLVGEKKELPEIVTR